MVPIEPSDRPLSVEKFRQMETAQGGIAWACELHRNGECVGTASNDGNGGADLRHWIGKEERERGDVELANVDGVEDVRRGHDRMLGTKGASLYERASWGTELLIQAYELRVERRRRRRTKS